MVKLDQAEIEFVAKDMASKTIDRIDSKVSNLEKSTKKSTKSMDSSFFSLGNSIKLGLGISIATLGVQLGQTLVEQMKNAIVTAVELEQQFAIFDRQSKNSTKLMEELRTATKGLVDDLSLIKSANRALAFGLEEESIPALAATAEALGKIQGLDATQAFNDIVVGIARASPLILDNLGIILDAEKTYSEYAESIGTTADALDKSQKLIALQKSTIQSSTTVVLQAATANKTTKESWEELGASIKNSLTGAANEGLTFFQERMKRLREEQYLQAEATRIQEERIQESGFTLDDYTNKQAIYNDLLVEMADNQYIFVNGAEDLSDAIYENANAIDIASNSLKAYKDELNEVRQIFSDFIKQETQSEFENDTEILKLKRQQLIVEQAIAKSREDNPPGMILGEDVEQARNFIQNYNDEYGTNISLNDDINKKIQERIDLLQRENEIASTSREIFNRENEAEILQALGEEELNRVESFKDYRKEYETFTKTTIPALEMKIGDLQTKIQNTNNASLELADNFVSATKDLQLLNAEAEKLQRIFDSIQTLKSANIDVEFEYRQSQLIGTSE